MTLILIFIAGLSNGIMDAVSFNFQHKLFRDKPWWDNNPFTGSWKNKYRNRNERAALKLLPSLGVYLFTDAWHFFKNLMIFSLLGAIIFYEPMFSNGELLGFVMPDWSNVLFDVITFRLLFGLGFYIPYYGTKK